MEGNRVIAVEVTSQGAWRVVFAEKKVLQTIEEDVSLVFFVYCGSCQFGWGRVWFELFILVLS